MAPRVFSAKISDWCRATEHRMMTVVKASAQDAFAIAQTPVGAGGRMPVDTGYLRASLLCALNGGVGTARGPDSYIMTIAQMKPDDFVRGWWQAEYAIYVERGSRGRPGRHFVHQLRSRWGRIVSRNVALARAAGI